MNPNELTPMRRWINENISAGKFCELVGVPRHVGEEQILHDVWLLIEKIERLRKLNSFQNQSLERKNRAIKMMGAAHKALMLERDDLKRQLDEKHTAFEKAHAAYESAHQINANLRAENAELKQMLVRQITKGKTP